ncbi:MAG: hypothetical protein AB1779_09210, partial [Candidatus Thermoplasmatota archaeon]
KIFGKKVNVIWKNISKTHGKKLNIIDRARVWIENSNANFCVFIEKDDKHHCDVVDKGGNVKFGDSSVGIEDAIFSAMKQFNIFYE